MVDEGPSWIFGEMVKCQNVQWPAQIQLRVKSGNGCNWVGVGLGNESILYQYRDMRLDIVLYFGYCDIVIWCLFLVLKAALQ